MWTVEAGRMLCKNGVPMFSIQRTGNMRISDADNVPHFIADLFNVTEDKVGGNLFVPEK